MSKQYFACFNFSFKLLRAIFSERDFILNPIKCAFHTFLLYKYEIVDKFIIPFNDKDIFTKLNECELNSKKMTQIIHYVLNFLLITNLIDLVNLIGL